MVAALVVLFVGSWAASAQTGGFDVSAFFGGNLAGSKLGSAFFLQTAKETSFKLDRDYLFGFRVSYNYSHLFSVEGSFTVCPGSMKAEIVDEEAGTKGDLKVLDATTYLFAVNARYSFPMNRLTPFVTAGIGTATIGTGSPVGFGTGQAPEGSTNFAFNLGCGLKYKWRDRIYFRGDLRRYFFDQDFGFSGFTKNPGVLELSFGVGFSFGVE
jgi:opacity protein-like surface antigen